MSTVQHTRDDAEPTEVARQEVARERVALIVITTCSVVVLLAVFGGLIGVFSTEFLTAVVAPFVAAGALAVRYYFPTK